MDTKNLYIYTSKTYFFYFTLPFLQNTHISLSIIHIYLNKIFIFRSIHTHPATTHQPTHLATAINPLNHHHPTKNPKPRKPRPLNPKSRPRPHTKTPRHQRRRWSCLGSNELHHGFDSLGLRCHWLGLVRYRKNLRDWPHLAEMSLLRPRCHLFSFLCWSCRWSYWCEGTEDKKERGESRS